MKYGFPILVAVFLLTGAAARGACGPQDPTGFYQGSAQSREAGNIAVTLNLRCDAGVYGGELVTPVGTFAILDGTFQNGRLSLRFGGGAIGDHGTLNLSIQGGSATGTFQLAADSGTFALTRLGPTLAAVPDTPDMNITKAQWHDDLRFFARELGARHINAFKFTSRSAFESEVASLDGRLDGLNSDAIYVGMDTIANRVGDGHTYIEFPPDLALFPLIIQRFDNEYRVTGVTAGYERALGTRVLRVGNMPVEKAYAALLAMTPVGETTALRDARATNFLYIGMALHGLGIIANRSTAQYTLENDSGKQFALTFSALAPSVADSIQYLRPWKVTPLYRQRPNEDFWFTSIGKRTVYCSFRGYQNLQPNAERLLNFVRANKPDKVVIDLRQNSGGDYKEGLKYLVEPISAMPQINRKGHLFVLIGTNTFSAAMSNAAQFRTQTHALLAGQPIGERPNSYQEANEIRLPNSHLLLRYSTQYYSFLPGARQNQILPDKTIFPTWDEVKAGKDPVLAWVLSYKPKR